MPTTSSLFCEDLDDLAHLSCQGRGYGKLGLEKDCILISMPRHCCSVWSPIPQIATLRYSVSRTRFSTRKSDPEEALTECLVMVRSFTTELWFTSFQVILDTRNNVALHCVQPTLFRYSSGPPWLPFHTQRPSPSSRIKSHDLKNQPQR